MKNKNFEEEEEEEEKQQETDFGGDDLEREYGLLGDLQKFQDDKTPFIPNVDVDDDQDIPNV